MHTITREETRHREILDEASRMNSCNTTEHSCGGHEGLVKGRTLLKEETSRATSWPTSNERNDGKEMSFQNERREIAKRYDLSAEERA